MRQLFAYARTHWRAVIFTLLMAAVSQALWIVDPLIVRHIVDEYATRFQSYTVVEFVRTVSLLLLAAIGVSVLARIARNLQEYYLTVITHKLGAEMYADGVQHVLKLPFSAFEDQRSGQTLATLQKLRSDVQRFIAVAINVFFTAVLGIVLVMFYAFSIHWVLAPVYLTAIPLLAYVSAVLSRQIKQMQMTIIGKTTALAGSTTESLRNIELVTSLGLAQQEVARLNATTQKILALELSKSRHVRLLSFVQGSSVSVIRTVILFLLLYLTYTQVITVGQLFSLIMCGLIFFGPLQELGAFVNTYREAEASLQVYDGIRRLPLEPKRETAVGIEALRSVTLEAVTFKHASAFSPSLSDVSFSASRGETIAFVGPSGAGKTTLIKLIVGLYRPHSGVVTYNGISQADVNLDTVRERIALVPQDAQLFSGTIRENLLFANQSATEEECREALRQAACDRLLARAGGGLDVMIGEAGLRISGGERQRLSIARALLRRPHLLIFDEATSALDSLTEEGIVATIREVVASTGAITILVAHRLSTVKHADRIYVLESGQIVDIGSHEELLGRNGLYGAMWRQQIGERRTAESAPMPPPSRGGLRLGGRRRLASA